YSSGLQVTGVFTEAMTGTGATISAADSHTIHQSLITNHHPAYLRTTGPTALAFANKQLPGQGKDRHTEGIGSPIGRWKGTHVAPETLTDDQLRSIGIAEGRKAKIEFESGIAVNGKVEKILRNNGNVILITFSNCSV